MSDVVSTPMTESEVSASNGPASTARASLALIAFFFALGLTVAYALRAEVIAGGEPLFADGLFERLANTHALVMVFFCSVPALAGVFGQLLVPAAVGRRDHAVPGLGLWSWRLHFGAGVLFVGSIVTGAIGAGWDLIGALNGAGTMPALLLGLGLHVLALAILCGALNQLATILVARREGNEETSILAWTFGVHGGLAIVTAPVIASWATLFVAQTAGGAQLFGLGAEHSLTSFARMFWLATQGGALLVIVAGTGLTLEILRDSTRTKAVATGRVGFALAALGLFGLFGYALPLSDDPSAAVAASALSLAMMIPAAVLAHTVWSIARAGIVVVDAALVHAMGFLLHCAVVGGAGLGLASLATGPVLRDTAFGAAQLHLLFAGCGLSAFLAACHRYWPQLAGRQLDDRIGMLAAALTFAGVQLAFLPRLALGALGLPALSPSILPSHESLTFLSTLGIVVLSVGVLIEGWAMMTSFMQTRSEKNLR